MKNFIYRLLAFFRKILVLLFDWKKRLDMDFYYKSKSDPWDRNSSIEQVKFSVNLIKDRQYRQCLDVGTGLGYFTELVSDICNSVVALDISSVAIKRAKERLKNLERERNIEFICANIRNWKPDRKFDLIILGEVLYYLGDACMPEEFYEIIKKLANTLEKNGRILLSHFITPWRNREWFSQNYIAAFQSCGLLLEKKAVFTQNGKEWFCAVLMKNKTNQYEITNNYSKS